MGKTERISKKEYKQFKWATQLRTKGKKEVQRKKILQDGVSRKYYRMGCCFWGRVYKKLPQDMGEGESGFFVTMRYEICLLKCF